MTYTSLLAARDLFTQEKYGEAASTLSKFLYDTYSGWEERRQYPSEKEIQSHGFGSLQELKDFEKSVMIKGINADIKQALEIDPDKDPAGLLNKLNDVIFLVFRSQNAGVIKYISRDLDVNAPQETIDNMLEGTGFESFDELKLAIEGCRDRLVVSKLEEFWENFQGQNYDDANKALVAAIKGPIAGSQPVTADLAKERSIPLTAQIAFVAKKGITLHDLDGALAQTALYLRIRKGLSEYSSPEKLVAVNDAIKSSGYDSYESLPDELKLALDPLAEGGMEKELMRLRVVSDMTGVMKDSYYGGVKNPVPRSDTVFLQDLDLVRKFAESQGRRSIFDIRMEDVTDIARISHDSEARKEWERAYKGTMAGYRQLLEDRDDPAYPASQVREDYYNAAHDGADLKMASLSDRVASYAHAARSALHI